MTLRRQLDLLNALSLWPAGELEGQGGIPGSSREVATLLPQPESALLAGNVPLYGPVVPRNVTESPIDPARDDADAAAGSGGFVPGPPSNTDGLWDAADRAVAGAGQVAGLPVPADSWELRAGLGAVAAVTSPAAGEPVDASATVIVSVDTARHDGFTPHVSLDAAVMLAIAAHLAPAANEDPQPRSDAVSIAGVMEALAVTGAAGSQQTIAVDTGADDAFILAGFTLPADGAIASQATTIAQQITTSAVALGVPQAIAEFAAATGGSLDGAGLTIGIISNSFDVQGGEASDIANGLLPPASQINILQEGPAGSDDEGRAMAQLVHAIAPDATIDFYSADGGDSAMAAGIGSLVAAGANIIVDDVVYLDEPFFQDTGPITEAAEAAVAAGVDYFTAVGNSSNNFYEQVFDPINFTLPGITSTVLAVDGVTSTSPYEAIYLDTNPSLAFTLEWTQPFNQNQYELGVAFYSFNGTAYSLVASVTTGFNSSAPVLEASGSLTLSAGTYYLAFFESGSGVGNDSYVTPGTFKIIFFQGSDAVVDGVNAGIGSGTSIGHEIAPGVNTVGAVAYNQTPAYGYSTPQSESFSGAGPGETYITSSGVTLATPIDDGAPAFASTDGSATSVFDPFYGTSAAAPGAAAVSLLLLQTDPRLATSQITWLLEQSAIPTNDPVTGGAGLIQANVAEAQAIVAAEQPVWTGQGGTDLWNNAANWSDDAVPGSTGTVQIANGLGLCTTAYTVVFNQTTASVAALIVDGGADAGAIPGLTIGAGDMLSAGTVTLGAGTISIGGTLISTAGLLTGAAPGTVVIGATGTLSLGVASGEALNSIAADGVTNNGVIDIVSGTLEVGVSSGSGVIRIEAGSTLELTQSLGSGQTIAFEGVGAALKIDTPVSLAQTLASFGAGDRIDLFGVTLTAATTVGDTLTLTAGATAFTFTSTASLANDHAMIQPVGDDSIVTLYAEAAAAPYAPAPVVFSNVHVGASATRSLTVSNIATPSDLAEGLDAGLNGVSGGFTAIGTITGLAAGATDAASLSLVENTSAPGALAGTATLNLQSDGTGTDGFGTTGLPSQTVDLFGSVYALAQPILSAGTINFGSVRVGGTLSPVTVTLSNGTTATPYQESLVYGASGPAGVQIVNGGGTIVSGGSDGIGFSFNTGTAASLNGTQATVTLTSTGAGTSGLVNTSLLADAITLAGKVYAPAVASLSTTSLNFGALHVGASASLTVGVTNSAVGALTDTLTGGSGIAAGGVSGVVFNLGAGLSAGASGSVQIGIKTVSDGVIAGSVALGFTSHDGDLSDLAINGGTVAVTGTLYNEATASVAAPSVVNFGIVHVGAAVDDVLGVTNTGTADGFTEGLDAGFISSTGAISGSGTISGLGASATDSGDLAIGLNTRNAGTVSGTAVLGLESDGAGIDGIGITSLAAQTIVAVGTVNNYALAEIVELSGGGAFQQNGSVYTLNLGTVSAGAGAQTIDLGVMNAATGPADLLQGTFAVAADGGADSLANNGAMSFSGDASGQVAGAPTITVNPLYTGVFSEALILDPTGYNGSGYFGIQTAQTLTITGTVVPAGYVLSRTPTTITGGAGLAQILATSNTIYSGDTIAPGGTGNTLVAQGAGLFDLRTPSVLSGVQVVDLEGAVTGQTQYLDLRAGLDLTVNVLDAAAVSVLGAANNDIINLGSGSASVTLGGPGETVNGGSGNETFYVTAATAGATINAGSGANTLNAQNGGTVVMGAGGGIQSVFLNTATTAYDFVANATANQIIRVSLNGNDTVVVGAASQAVYGYSGALTVQATAANAGAFVRTGAGGATLDITTGGSVALNSGDANLTVMLTAADTLVVPTTASVRIAGEAGNDTFVATSNVLRVGQTITAAGSGNTLIAQGAGFFDLRAPAVLSGVQVVDLVGAPAGQTQYLDLRAGQSLTVNVLDAAAVSILGNADSDIINLGSGAASVTLGGPGETVNGGTGSDTFYVTAATAGATINAGSGVNTLEAQNGGTVAMGAGIIGVTTVFLNTATSAYDFVANVTANLTIHATIGGNDTVVVGAASQTVDGYNGALTVHATAANAGALVRAGAGGATLDITTVGSVVLNNADNNVVAQLAAGDTLVLPTNASTVIEGNLAGNDTFVATSNVLRAGQTIMALGGGNTLIAQGAGFFDLRAPSVLSGVQVVDLVGAVTGQTQYLDLRAGQSLTVNVLDAAAVSILGNADSDIINLGSGAASVTLGGPGETVNGGSGNETFYVNAATAGATINAGSGANTLNAQNGGTVVMGAGGGIQSVFLNTATTAYDFVANATANQIIRVSLNGNDTVVVGAASQAVYGYSGALTVQATAANAGAFIRTGAGGATLDITTGGSVALNASDTNLKVQLSAETNLALGPLGFITAIGAPDGHDTISAGGANQTLESIGSNDMLIGSASFHDTFMGASAGINGDTIQAFGGLGSLADRIDLTDMATTGTLAYSGTTTQGTLVVSDGTHVTSIAMAGNYTAASFSPLTTDGHGGSLIAFLSG